MHSPLAVVNLFFSLSLFLVTADLSDYDPDEHPENYIILSLRFSPSSHRNWKEK